MVNFKLRKGIVVVSRRGNEIKKVTFSFILLCFFAGLKIYQSSLIMLDNAQCTKSNTCMLYLIVVNNSSE